MILKSHWEMRGTAESHIGTRVRIGAQIGNYTDALIADRNTPIAPAGGWPVFWTITGTLTVVLELKAHCVQDALRKKSEK